MNFKDDLNDLHKHCVEFGGEVAEPLDADHWVIDVNSGSFFDDSAMEKPVSCYLVTSMWFWYSIQLGLCANEDLYLVKQKDDVC